MENLRPLPSSIVAMTFFEDFHEFAVSTGVPFTTDGAGFFRFFGEHPLNVRLVPISEAVARIEWEMGVTCIFEDRWHTARELLQSRLLAHLGHFKSIFARKCEVFCPTPQECREFLEKYHIYGWARCKYRYALCCNGEIVAVSTFSAPRPMMRCGRRIQSYEWVRFASLPDVRISGGMGRLLEAFVRDEHPQDIMSYADLEWSDGAVYERLGFKLAGHVSPVEFVVDPLTWQRVHLSKILRHGDGVPDGACIIHNLGSAKYVKTL